MRRAAWLLLVGAAFVVGLWVGHGGGLGLRDVAAPPVKTPPCRPSQPHLLQEQPAILFWGNSLAFDHSWNIPGHVVVNCALQGLTAQRAAALTPALPDMEVSAIVLVFGTVELLRDINDPAPFRQGVRTVIDRLRQRHPDAEIVMVGIPAGEGWSYATHSLLGVLNTALKRQERVAFLDTSQTLDRIPPKLRSYDGLHLAGRSYEAIEAALSSLLGAGTY